MVSLSIPPDGVLDADHAGEVGQSPDGVGRQVLAGPVRDVIDDERDRTFSRERREVRDDAGLAGTQKGWHHTERRDHLCAATQRRQGLRRVGADDQLSRALAAYPSDHIDDAALFRRGQRGRFRRRAQRHDAGRTSVQHVVCQASSVGEATESVASNGVIRGTYTPVRVMTSASATEARKV